MEYEEIKILPNGKAIHRHIRESATDNIVDILATAPISCTIDISTHDNLFMTIDQTQQVVAMHMFLPYLPLCSYYQLEPDGTAKPFQASVDQGKQATLQWHPPRKLPGAMKISLHHVRRKLWLCATGVDKDGAPLCRQFPTPHIFEDGSLCTGNTQPSENPKQDEMLLLLEEFLTSTWTDHLLSDFHRDQIEKWFKFDLKTDKNILPQDESLWHQEWREMTEPTICRFIKKYYKERIREYPQYYLRDLASRKGVQTSGQGDKSAE